MLGNIVKVSGMCTLPVNIVNEKIYLILWFAFILHTILSMLQLLRQAPLIRLFIVETPVFSQSFFYWTRLYLRSYL